MGVILYWKYFPHWNKRNKETETVNFITTRVPSESHHESFTYYDVMTPLT